MPRVGEKKLVAFSNFRRKINDNIDRGDLASAIHSSDYLEIMRVGFTYSRSRRYIEGMGYFSWQLAAPLLQARDLIAIVALISNEQEEEEEGRGQVIRRWSYVNSGGESTSDKVLNAAETDMAADIADSPYQHRRRLGELSLLSDAETLTGPAISSEVNALMQERLAVCLKQLPRP